MFLMDIPGGGLLLLSRAEFMLSFFTQMTSKVPTCSRWRFLLMKVPIGGSWLLQAACGGSYWEVILDIDRKCISAPISITWKYDKIYKSHHWEPVVRSCTWLCTITNVWKCCSKKDTYHITKKYPWDIKNDLPTVSLLPAEWSYFHSSLSWRFLEVPGGLC